MCVYVLLCTHAYPCGHMQRPEVDTRCLPRSLLFLIYGDRVVHWTCWFGQDWLASELQISTVCFTRCQSYICYNSESQILCGCFILCHKYFACWDTSPAPINPFLKTLILFLCICYGVYVGTRGQLLGLILSFHHMASQGKKLIKCWWQVPFCWLD